MGASAGVRRTVQIPIRVAAAVAGGLSFLVALVYVVALLLHPPLALLSVLFAANGLLAFRISVSDLGVARVPRKTLLVLVGANAWLGWSGTGPLPLRFAVGLFCASASAALLLDLAHRTPRVPAD